MTHEIKLLSPQLINKIAAGEVVERPASIVKELTENSIDAGATTITIKLEKAGIQYLEVQDNGKGMNQIDLKLAFVQHATSKLTKEADLNNIISMGFRGEALASISSVSNTSIYSRQHDKNQAYIATNNNEKIEVKPTNNKQAGTTVIVRNLFKTIPARRKFLRSETTEYKHILDTFIKLAIANPQISFELFKDNKLQHKLKATSTQDERIYQLFSTEKIGQLIPISYDDLDFKISGFISHPRQSTNRKDIQYIFVNGRCISNQLISKAAKDGYASTLMNHMHPQFFIFIQANPNLVDVNIHPRKEEIKFENPQLIYKLIKKTVQKALENELQEQTASRLMPTIVSNRVGSIPTNTPRAVSITPSHKNSENRFRISNPSKHTKKIDQSLVFSQQLLSPIHPQEANIKEEKPALDLSKISQTSVKQFFLTYLVIESDEKLLFIDQHAAAERVRFEEITNKLDRKELLSKQTLLIPESFSINPSEREVLSHNQEKLSNLGFEVQLDNKQVTLKSIPTIIPLTKAREVFQEMLFTLTSQDDYIESGFEPFEQHILATLACHSSIRAGESLQPEKIQKLISDLLTTKLPYSCPHGRPIIWELSRYELEKNFKRKL